MTQNTIESERASGFDASSGKGAADENFPVGSFLLPAHLRPHVATFYAYARAIDDIADAPELSRDEKWSRLEAFERELMAPTGEAGLEKAAAMRTSLAETGVCNDHCRDLIRAFRQDADKARYADWPELMAYCRLSAAPVGRYLIDLHGVDDAAYPASDALCHALQVINHLQDCGDDFRKLDRIYLPQDWMKKYDVDDQDVGFTSCSSGLRKVIDRCLVETASLVIEAYQLPRQIENRRLRLEASVIVRLADALVWRLSSRDPLAERVELGRLDALFCLIRGLIGGFIKR